MITHNPFVTHKFKFIYTAYCVCLLQDIHSILLYSTRQLPYAWININYANVYTCCISASHTLTSSRTLLPKTVRNMRFHSKKIYTVHNVQYMIFNLPVLINHTIIKWIYVRCIGRSISRCISSCIVWYISWFISRCIRRKC